jgi:hypothetical protein
MGKLYRTLQVVRLFLGADSGSRGVEVTATADQINQLAGGSYTGDVTGDVTGNVTGTVSIKPTNKIINGSFELAQRGTTIDATTGYPNSDDNYCLDRWNLLSDGDDIVDITRESSGGVDGQSKFIQLDVETAEKKFGILQVIENANLHDVIGGTVSIGFDAIVSDATKLSDIRAVVLSWDSTADTVTSDVVNAWGAEGVIPTLVANWTAENVAANLSVTESWARYTIENISIDTASTTNVALFIYQNNVATNDTVTETLGIANVQLEVGTKANPFYRKGIREEIADCQRYFWKTYSIDVDPGTVTDAGKQSLSSTGHSNLAYVLANNIYHPVEMRAAPTIHSYDDAGAVDKVTMSAGNGITPVYSRESTRSARVFADNVAASATRTLSFQATADAEL